MCILKMLFYLFLSLVVVAFVCLTSKKRVENLVFFSICSFLKIKPCVRHAQRKQLPTSLSISIVQVRWKPVSEPLQQVEENETKKRVFFWSEIFSFSCKTTKECKRLWQLLVNEIFKPIICWFSMVMQVLLLLEKQRDLNFFEHFFKVFFLKSSSIGLLIRWLWNTSSVESMLAVVVKVAESPMFL